MFNGLAAKTFGSGSSLLPTFLNWIRSFGTRGLEGLGFRVCDFELQARIFREYVFSVQCFEGLRWRVGGESEENSYIRDSNRYPPQGLRG